MAHAAGSEIHGVGRAEFATAVELVLGVEVEFVEGIVEIERHGLPETVLAPGEAGERIVELHRAVHLAETGGGRSAHPRQRCREGSLVTLEVENGIRSIGRVVGAE